MSATRLDLKTRTVIVGFKRVKVSLKTTDNLARYLDLKLKLTQKKNIELLIIIFVFFNAIFASGI